MAERIPIYFRNQEPPIISYEYTNTIASKLFNFALTLSNLDIMNYLSSPHSCQCETSKFCYKPHGHVITGHLMVIENMKLRELVSKGSKYREPNKISWSATGKMLFESIDLYAEWWAKREQVILKYLSEWKDRVKELAVDRISGLISKFKSPKCKVLNKPDVKDTPEKLHADFILVSADKTANDVIVVCKKYNIEIDFSEGA